MSTLGTSVLTLADWAKRLDPDGKIARIVEMLSQTNGILQDAKFMEGNLPVGHRCTVRTGLPTVYWRLLNQGTQPSKSTTAQVDESCGILEAWSEVDQDLAELGGNVNEFRLSEASAFLEAMNQEMASTMFYGNSSISPEEFNGLSVRYGDLSAANAQNIIDAGGTGSDNSSIWLTVWGEQGIYGIFPKGSKAGIEHENIGLVTVETTAGVAGSRMRAYQDHWKWKVGIALKDWRQVVRIANIDISALVAESSAANLTKLLIKATHRIHSLNMGSPVIYMNRSVFQYLDIQRLDAVAAGGGITYQTVDGVMTPFFRQIPIRICDALTETEARVV
jgi:hypothetical protein